MHTSDSCCRSSWLVSGSGSSSETEGVADVAAGGGKRLDSRTGVSSAGASTSRHGLPGIMPADFAARSIAPEAQGTSYFQQKEKC